MKIKMFEMNPEFDKKRQEANREIVKRITEVIEKHPEQRFVQILWGLGIISSNVDGEILDRFYEEPWITLTRVENNYEK